ncbi:MAG: TlpA family protein disulfide reductase [Chloroflexota bacterium]
MTNVQGWGKVSTRRVLALVTTVLIAVALLLPTMPARAATTDYAVPGGWYYGQTGHSVVDTSEGKFFSSFTRLGAVDALGYPISAVFERDGFRYQAFQRAILQWRPELQQCLLANVMDWLSTAGKDDILVILGVPAPQNDNSNGDFARAVAERESWLTDSAIAQAYRQGGGYERFGLPTSLPVQSGPFVAQRFQRYAFQHWIEDVPGMPPKGSVVGVLTGDIAKMTRLLTSEDLNPREPAAALTPPLAPPAAAEGVNIGNIAASFPMKTMDGRTVTLRDYRGTPVMLTFFATWCPSCRYQLTNSNGIKRANPDVAFLQVSTEAENVISSYASSTGQAGVFLRDHTNQGSALYNVRGVPTNIFIDKNGVIKDIIVGGLHPPMVENALKKIR